MISTLCAMVLMLLAAPGEYHVAPYVKPNVITIDGEMSEWIAVPNVVERFGFAYLTFNSGEWEGESDLGAILQIAWNETGIYIVSGVIDDQITSKHTGSRARHGDHVAMWIDAIPMIDAPQPPDAGQAFVVLSPGRFDADDQAPMLYVHRPVGDLHVGEVAAKTVTWTKVANAWLPNSRLAGGVPIGRGYVIEAFVSFERLGIAPPSIGDDVNFELAVCDSDHAWNEWRTMVTVGREPFSSARSRLVPLVFGDAQGHGVAPLREVRFADTLDVAAESTGEVAAMIERLPDGKRAVLSFKSRSPSERSSGYHQGAVTVQVNGMTIEASRLINKPAASTMVDGRPVVYMTDQNRLTLAYAPDYRAADASPTYADADGYPTCVWAFDVTDLLGVGDNVISFVNHVHPDEHSTAKLADIEIRFLPAP
jgi:hypothetical protein